MTNSNENIINLLEIIKKGKSRINSVSKIKKINAIIKNREEKITLDVFNGSRPHSKGELNAWFSKNLPLIKAPRLRISITTNTVKKIFSLSWKIKT